MLQAVFNKLKSLQVVLSRKCEIENELKEIPKLLTTKLELLKRLKKAYDDKQKSIEEINARIKLLRQRMQECEEEREKYEKQMDQIKTQREYEALDKQIKDLSAQEAELRKEIQKQEAFKDDLQSQLEKEKNLIAKQEEEVKNEQNKIKQELKDKQKILKSLEKEEARIIPGLDEDILFKFERIIKSKGGVGIVPIRNGVCTGCHMILPMQFVNDVRAGEKIYFCPECSRILFFQEDGGSNLPFIYEEIIDYKDEEEEESEDEYIEDEEDIDFDKND